MAESESDALKRELAGLIADAFAPAPAAKAPRRPAPSAGRSAASSATAVKSMLDGAADASQAMLLLARMQADAEAAAEAELAAEEEDGEAGDGDADAHDEEEEEEEALVDEDEGASETPESTPVNPRASATVRPKPTPTKPTQAANGASPKRGPGRRAPATAPTSGTAGKASVLRGLKLAKGTREWGCPVCRAVNRLAPAAVAPSPTAPGAKPRVAACDEYLVKCSECGCRPLAT